MPNRYGLLFIAVLSGMLVGSVNYNNNLGFLLTFLLGSMMFVSLFQTHRNLAGLEILFVDVEPVFAGQTACYRITTAGSEYRRPVILFKFEGQSGCSKTDIIEKENNVKLDIFQLNQSKVTTLLDSKLTTGKYEYNWIPHDISSGVYIYRIRIGNFEESRKLIFSS